MKKKKRFGISLSLLAAFTVWTVAVCFVDVQAIGPQNSPVGFAALNRSVHSLTGVNMGLYRLTDRLGLVPLGVMAAFALLGLTQWIRRKKLWSVDRSILLLGGFYLVVIAAYGFFEYFVVNYRPVLINGVLEASYPSSTTLLVLCVMPTAAMQLLARIRNSLFRRCVSAAIAIFAGFMVLGRLISGVHWFTDIVGGVLFSAGLVSLYSSVSGLTGKYTDTL